MKTPLYTKLLQYAENTIPFHMPGHKFGQALDIDAISLMKLDNTEAIGLDNLYEAEGIIKDAMQEMACFYGAKHTLFVTNGSTGGILASILYACKPGDKIIVARNCHYSVWNALILSGAIPIFLSPTYDKKYHVIGDISKEQLEQAIKQHPDAKAVIIVSPTYEGVVSDIKHLASIVHRAGKLLIVDEAHGAHFGINDFFPKSSLYYGADLVIHSMHKTMPALTQSALLHIGSDRIDKDRLMQSLKMIQTSSPSYLMMGLMDYIRGCMQEIEKQAFIKENYIHPLLALRKTLKGLKHLKLIDRKSSFYDRGKIVLVTNHCNVTGYDIAKMLYERFSIAVEAAMPNEVILMTTIADNKITLQKLEKALIQIDTLLQEDNKENRLVYDHLTSTSDGISLREVYYAEKEWIPIEKSIGRINARQIMLYPPGIPLLCMGEKVTKEIIEKIVEWKIQMLGVKIIEDKVFIETVVNI